MNIRNRIRWAKFKRKISWLIIPFAVGFISVDVILGYYDLIKGLIALTILLVKVILDLDARMQEYAEAQ